MLSFFPGRNTFLHWNLFCEFQDILQSPVFTTNSSQILKTLFQAPVEHHGFYIGYATWCVNSLFTCLLSCYILSSLKEGSNLFLIFLGLVPSSNGCSVHFFGRMSKWQLQMLYVSITKRQCHREHEWKQNQLVTDGPGTYTVKAGKGHACLPRQSALKNMLGIGIFEHTWIFLEHIILICFIC